MDYSMLQYILAIIGFILGLILVFRHPSTRGKSIIFKCIVGLFAGLGFCVLLNLAREGAEYAGILDDSRKMTREEVEQYVKDQLEAESHRTVDSIRLSSSKPDDYSGEAKIGSSTYSISAVIKKGKVNWVANKLQDREHSEKKIVEEIKTQPIPTVEYSIDSKSKLAYTSKHDLFLLYLQPDSWKKSSEVQTEDAEIEYNHTKNDIYACVIQQRIGGTTKHLKNNVIARLRKQDPKATISSEEARKINGKDVLCLTMLFTVEGVGMASIVYLYADAKCMIQSFTFTGQNIFGEMKPEMESFLNGILIK